MAASILYRGFNVTVNQCKTLSKLFKKVECFSNNTFIHHISRSFNMTAPYKRYILTDRCKYPPRFNLKINCFSSSAIQHDSNDIKQQDKKDVVTITYIGRDGVEHVIDGKVGDNVMYLAQKHDLDVEGACEASLACCTCHVYVEKHFDKLNEIDEEEEDMLDLAPFLQENSRLSCQIILSNELNNIVVRLPSATRNFYVDGHKPKPH